ncbi:MAG: FmdB family transcriptional regulator [Acidobacteria bacterium]|nr:FmdB family transcriptional regulator [Acidobacteriota bacterium]
MPIYEFQCDNCQHDFEILVYSSTTPTCPACASLSVQKRLSAFAVGHANTRTIQSAPQGACGSCGDPRGAGACSLN